MDQLSQSKLYLRVLCVAVSLAVMPFGLSPVQSAELGSANQPKEDTSNGKGKQVFHGPDGRQLPSPEEILKRKPETKSDALSGSTYGETLLQLGTTNDFSLIERDLIKSQIKAFIPPLLQSAIVGDAFVLPPNTFRVAVDYGFVNMNGQKDFSGATGTGNFNGVRRQFTTLNLLYGFDLNAKFLHSFTAAVTIPYISTQVRGFVQPGGAGTNAMSNTAAMADLGPISIAIKKKLIDQANFPVGLAIVGGVSLPTASNEKRAGTDGMVNCQNCASSPTRFTRFNQEGGLPTVLQPGNGDAFSYMIGGFLTRQFLPGDLPFLSGTPFDRGAFHAGVVHRFNVESRGYDPGDQTVVFASLVNPIYKDYLALEVANTWLFQQFDHYLPLPNGNDRAPFTQGVTGMAGPGLIFSPDPQIRLRLTSMFRVKDPSVGPSPPYMINMGIDVTF